MKKTFHLIQEEKESMTTSKIAKDSAYDKTVTDYNQSIFRIFGNLL